MCFFYIIVPAQYTAFKHIIDYDQIQQWQNPNTVGDYSTA